MFPYHQLRVPHIWPSFGQMWELTDAGATVPVTSENFRSATSLIPTSRQNRARYGAPSFVVRKRLEPEAYSRDRNVDRVVFLIAIDEFVVRVNSGTRRPVFYAELEALASPCN